MSDQTEREFLEGLRPEDQTEAFTSDQGPSLPSPEERAARREWLEAFSEDVRPHFRIGPFTLAEALALLEAVDRLDALEELAYAAKRLMWQQRRDTAEPYLRMKRLLTEQGFAPSAEETRPEEVERDEEECRCRNVDILSGYAEWQGCPVHDPDAGAGVSEPTEGPRHV